MDLTGEVVRVIPSMKRLATKIRLERYPVADEGDLLQDGMVGLLEAQARYEEGHGATFFTFGSKRARGAMLDGLRNDAKHAKVVASLEERVHEVTEARLARERSLESREMLIQFRRFLSKYWYRLPRPLREVIRLRYLKEMSVREVGSVLGLSPASVCRREQEGLEWLRKKFLASRKTRVSKEAGRRV